QMAAQVRVQTRTYVIEGLIGTGKSSLVRNLALIARLECWSGGYEFAREPVEYYRKHRYTEKNLLQQFYDGDLSAFEFQVHVSHEMARRDMKLRKIAAKCTHRFIVSEKKTKAVTSREDCIREPELALQRIRQRNRPEEANIDLDYLQGLHSAQQATFPSYGFLVRLRVTESTSVEDLSRLVRDLVQGSRQPPLSGGYTCIEAVM
uniref:DNK domain-containing protein n=1 Tax=Macrostomum lignano TaxID=282301 RepID=A0A1I8G0Y7_9PLAT